MIANLLRGTRCRCECTVFPGFTIGKAWERACKRVRVASHKMFRAKSGVAKALPVLLLALASFHTLSLASGCSV